MENKEIALEKLFDLFLIVCSLKPNKKAKTPSVNIKQGQAMEILFKLNELASLYGKKIVMYNEGGETLVKMEEV